MYLIKNKSESLPNTPENREDWNKHLRQSEAVWFSKCPGFCFPLKEKRALEVAVTLSVLQKHWIEKKKKKNLWRGGEEVVRRRVCKCAGVRTYSRCVCYGVKLSTAALSAGGLQRMWVSKKLTLSPGNRKQQGEGRKCGRIKSRQACDAFTAALFKAFPWTWQILLLLELIITLRGSGFKQMMNF